MLCLISTYLAEGQPPKQTSLYFYTGKKELLMENKMNTIIRNFIGVRDYSCVRIRLKKDEIGEGDKNLFIRRERFPHDKAITTGVMKLEYPDRGTWSSKGTPMTIAILHTDGLVIKTLNVEDADPKGDITTFVEKVLYEFIMAGIHTERAAVVEKAEKIYIFPDREIELELGSGCYYCGDRTVEYWMR